MKTVRLTEKQINDLINEAVNGGVKQITAGGPLEGEMDVPAYEVNREINKIVSYLDEIAERYLDKVTSAPNGELYETFGYRLFAISEGLEQFMKDNGYDKALRKDYSRFEEK